MFRPLLELLDRPELRDDEPRDPLEPTLGWLRGAGALRTERPLFELGRDWTAGGRLLLGDDRTERLGAVERGGGW